MVIQGTRLLPTCGPTVLNIRPSRSVCLWSYASNHKGKNVKDVPWEALVSFAALTSNPQISVAYSNKSSFLTSVHAGSRQAATLLNGTSHSRTQAEGTVLMWNMPLLIAEKKNKKVKAHMCKHAKVTSVHILLANIQTMAKPKVNGMRYIHSCRRS